MGKEPAINTAEVVVTDALPTDYFRNEDALRAFIQKKLNGQTCDSIHIDPKGRAIFPGGTPGIVVGFEQEKVAKINKQTHYALIVGCFVYETMNETHRTEFCGILEPPPLPKIGEATLAPFTTRHNNAASSVTVADRTHRVFKARRLLLRDSRRDSIPRCGGFPTLGGAIVMADDEFAEWQIDKLAAKIDPSALHDDSIVIGSVPARREAARREALRQLRDQAGFHPIPTTSTRT